VQRKNVEQLISYMMIFTRLMTLVRWMVVRRGISLTLLSPLLMSIVCEMVSFIRSTATFAYCTYSRCSSCKQVRDKRSREKQKLCRGVLRSWAMQEM